MVVSIHNYLYANPTQYGLMVQGMKNIPAISKYLTNQMRVPANQIMHLSDAAKENPTPPTKSVVESTITEFLKSSRKQDHLMLVFVGHAVENDGQVYLAPIEGDLTDPTSLIPLAWLYKELDTCAAHQKILVLDVCRFSPTIGIERPGGQPMSAKMEEVIKAVPAGLQVITACSAEQRSMETDGEPLGVFLDGFVDALQKVFKVRSKGRAIIFQLISFLRPLLKMLMSLQRNKNSSKLLKCMGCLKIMVQSLTLLNPCLPNLPLLVLNLLVKRALRLLNRCSRKLELPGKSF